MESYYVGTDLKFKIDINAQGFSMQDDDFYITLAQGNYIVNVPKEKLVQNNGDFYLLVDTTSFKSGTIRMITTAMVPDDDFDTGFRREVVAVDLCTLKQVM